MCWIVANARFHHLPRNPNAGQGYAGTTNPGVSWGLHRPDRMQKSGQLRCCLVLRNRRQFLERAGEGIRQAPHRPGLELLMRGLKVQIMDPPCQVLGKACLFLDECLVDQQLRRSRGQLHRPPLLYLLLQRSEVPLHPVHPNGQAVPQRKVLGMLCEDGSVHTWDNATKMGAGLEMTVSRR